MPPQHPFLKVEAKAIKKRGPVIAVGLWLNTVFVTGIILMLASIYQRVRAEHFTVVDLNRSVAFTAMIVIGLSFALSGLCYFWNFVDTKIVYRKYLGIVGWVVLLMHFVISIALIPERFPFPEYYIEHIVPFIFGLAGLFGITFMAVISHKHFIAKFGGVKWRKLLRLGYWFYLFGVIHYAIRGFEFWGRWMREMDSLPPLSMLATIFALWVFGLRIALWHSTTQKMKALQARGKAKPASAETRSRTQPAGLLAKQAGR